MRSDLTYTQSAILYDASGLLIFTLSRKFRCRKDKPSSRDINEISSASALED